MWFDGVRRPNTIYVANSSRGKDSTAMLRAIQLMGWPLDMIVSVDIWFDEDTPAELPPMVKFKDEYDQKVLDWFGVPVTRLCAQKTRSKIVQVERESGITGNQKRRKTDKLTQECFTTGHNEESMSGQLKDSQNSRDHGARNSNTKKLTYHELFYNPRHGEKQIRKLLTAYKDSPIFKPQGVLQIEGFPFLRGPWCNGYLKRDVLKPKAIIQAWER